MLRIQSFIAFNAPWSIMEYYNKAIVTLETDLTTEYALINVS
jgi:hypothetical protein